jgi:Xaa-Pro aminopeptidase
MILSDEPGFYAPGRYGIRLENLLLVQQAALADSAKSFLRFETLTLAPFDRRLIEPALLSLDEMAWVDAYHARVLAEVGPALERPGSDRAVRDWLIAACKRLGG